MNKFAIICIDDEQAMLDSLEIELNQVLDHHYLIETASDSQEALDLIDDLWKSNYEIPIVIADYIMPNMKGDEVLRRVHALSPKTLKIMLTGHATLDAMAYAIKYANLYRYISKPLDSNDFQLTIREALNSYFQARKLEQFYADLEIKIIERTRELHEKNAQLITLNQEKNEFLGIAAHDLKNPLSAIQSLAELIINNFDSLPKDKIISYTNMIHISSKKMFELIQNLLDVNKIESGKINLNLEAINIASIAQEVATSYIEPAKAKSIILHFHAQKKHCMASVDRHAIYQVMDNLISNAIKYSPHGKNVYVRITLLDKKIRFEVQDEGQGLNEEDVSKLFRKFTRLSTKPTGGEHSTGLGLFIVRKLSEAMQAKVWCESELHKGATFIIEFLDIDCDSRT